MTISINDYVIDSVIENLLKDILKINFLNNQLYVQVLINFLKNPGNSSKYTQMKELLDFVTQKCLESANEQIKINGSRILCTLPDGTVFYDSGKGDKNTFENFKSKSINENHNSRYACFESLKAGDAYETKFSTSGQNKREYYYGYRLGSSVENSLGVLRLSLK